MDDAIRVGGTAHIENSTLTINGLDEYNDEGGMHPLITKDGDLIVENSTITAMDTGDEVYYYQYGLWLGGKLEVSNSVLTLGAQDCAMNADSMEAGALIVRSLLPWTMKITFPFRWMIPRSSCTMI